MARNKKRIQKKKTIIKKTIKKIIKHNIEHNKPSGSKNETNKTAEQQARDNEMIKTMLARQQPIVQGQTQQNDKYQQQIDTLNKLYNTQLKDNETKKSQITELKNMLDDSKKEIRRIEDEAKHQAQINKQEEKNIKQQEAAKKRLEKELDKAEELEDKKREHDLATEEGKHQLKMEIADYHKRELERSIKDNKMQIEKNKLYNAFVEKKDELEVLETELASQNEILNSNNFKEPDKALIDVNKRIYLAKWKQQNNDERIKKEIEIGRIKAEKEGQQQYYNKLIAGRKIHVLTKSGEWAKNTNGKDWLYEKDKDGNFKINPDDNMLNDYRKQLAEQLRNKQESEIELQKYNMMIDYANKTKKETNKAIIEAENEAESLKQMRKYYESRPFNDKLKIVEQQKQLTNDLEAKNENMKKQIELQKRIQEMEARGKVLAQFDPNNMSPDAIQAQMSEYVEQISRTQDDMITKQRQQLEKSRMLNDWNEVHDNIINRYENQEAKNHAHNNLFELIERKTEGKLTDDMTDWDAVNLGRAIEFANMINRFDPELLINTEKLDGFVNDKEFNEF